MKRLYAVLILSVLCAPGPASPMEKALSLREAVEAALANNHEVRALGSALAAHAEEIGIARSMLLPRVTFEERFLRTTNPTYAFMAKLNQERFAPDDFAIERLNNPQAVSDFQTSISLEQPLFAPRALIGLSMTRTEHAARQEDFTRKKQETALKVTQAFLAVLTAKEYVSVAGTAVEDAREHRRIAGLRHDAGLGLYSDILRASTALTEAEQRLVTARKNLQIARRALGLLLGTDSPVDAAGPAPEIQVAGLAVHVAAAEARQDIRSIELRHENSKSNLKFAEAGYLPVVGIGGSYQVNDHRRPFGSEGESWQVMAFLRWELFDGTKREHERERAKHQAAEAGEYLSGMKKAVSFKVHEAFLNVEEARKNLELSRAAFSTAEEGRRLVKVRYESGLSPIVDLLDAQVSLDHARAGTAARENEYRLAAATLAYESGTILSNLNIGQ